MSDGVTPSERYLARLCRKSFLRLWSWPNLYRDQKTGPKTQGKEVCDLLALFDRHVFLFSDKYCAFPSTGDLKTDWSRWFRNAVWEGAKQIWGAERWVRQHPKRLFCDPDCSVRLPINVPSASDAIFHRVVVAHGASRRCREALGGSGSLILNSSVIGKQHFDPSKDAEPFVVGSLDPARGVVHVMDDVTLDVILATVDTVSDLAHYFEAKERLVTSERVIHAAGEEELLAVYLMNTDSDGRHTFPVPDDTNHVGVESGLWEDFQRRRERLAQVEANRESYAWDALIEEFTKNVLGGTEYFQRGHSVAEVEVALRLMAAENRTERRGLSRALLAAMKRGQETNRFARIIARREGSPQSTNYVFLTLKHPETVPHDNYRRHRRTMLTAYCMAFRAQTPSAKHIVGIAMAPMSAPNRGEDLVYIDGSDWGADQQAEGERLKRELNVMQNLRPHEMSDREYPSPDALDYTKGRNRNLWCPCGSGKKVKRCRHS